MNAALLLNFFDRNKYNTHEGSTNEKKIKILYAVGIDIENMILNKTIKI